MHSQFGLLFVITGCEFDTSFQKRELRIELTVVRHIVIFDLANGLLVIQYTNYW